MANCVNCGVKLNSFNETFPLWDDTNEKLCSKCRDHVRKFFKHNNLEFGSIEITKDFIAKNEIELQQHKISQTGIKYLTNYAMFLEQSHTKHKAEQAAIAERISMEQKNQERAKEQWNDNCAAFLETTGFTFEGYKIIEYKGIMSGEIVLGTGFLSELSASINDFLGTVSTSMTEKLTQAKQIALHKLKENCLSVCANAAIGIDFDVTTIGTNMIVVCANGTAVRIEKL